MKWTEHKITNTQIDFLRKCIKEERYPFDTIDNVQITLRIIKQGTYTDTERTLLNLWMKWIREEIQEDVITNNKILTHTMDRNNHKIKMKYIRISR